MSGKGDHKRSYFIYPQCLVEILAAEHRIIPWEAIREKLGTSQAAVAALRSYRFSAGAGKDILFDSSLPRHEQLAVLLRSRGGKSASSHIPAAAGASTQVAPLAGAAKVSRDPAQADTTRSGQSEIVGLDDAILANPQLLMKPIDLGTTEFPAVETALLTGDIAFRQHSGGHTAGPNWPYCLEFAGRYLKAPGATSSSPTKLN